MSENVLSANCRNEIGSQQVKQLRKSGWVPGIVYGSNIEPSPIKINKIELAKFFHTLVSEHQLIKLSIDNKLQDVLVKEVTYHNYRNEVIHVDFHKIAMDKKITTTVPVQEVGACKGVLMGGILEHIMRELEIECLPKDLPAFIEVDITNLDIGDSIHVGELPVINGIKFLDDPIQPVISVISSVIAEDVPAEATEGATGAEPELIRKREKVEE